MQADETGLPREKPRNKWTRVHTTNSSKSSTQDEQTQGFRFRSIKMKSEFVVALHALVEPTGGRHDSQVDELNSETSGWLFMVATSKIPQPSSKTKHGNPSIWETER